MEKTGVLKAFFQCEKIRSDADAQVYLALPPIIGLRENPPFELPLLLFSNIVFTWGLLTHYGALTLL